MKWVKDGLVDALSKIETSRTDTVKDIITELEKRAIGVGAVTYDGMHAAIKACLEDAGVTGLVDKLTASQTAEVQVDEGDNQSTPCHYWGGKFRRVQSDFDIPDCSVRQMWLLWVCGNNSKQIPPLRQFDGRDMPSRKLQKRLSQLRFVMSKIEKAAASKNLLHDSQNVDEATQIFVACSESVDIDTRTEHSRKRRRGQLSWATVGKLLRKKAKQQ